MSTRLRRVEQVERNREVVLAAARTVFLARGYAGATLEAIAEEAGFSKGVVYSQFGSKGDLFLALLDRRIEERAAQHERIADQLSGEAGILELLRVSEQDSRAEQRWARLLVEFRALAAWDPDLNRRYTRAHASTISHLVDVLGRLHEKAGLAPAVPLATMASFVLAIGTGMTLERLGDNDRLGGTDTKEMMRRAFGFGTGGKP